MNKTMLQVGCSWFPENLLSCSRGRCQPAVAPPNSSQGWLALSQRGQAAGVREKRLTPQPGPERGVGEAQPGRGLEHLTGAARRLL